jgi:hypothetical protein
MAIAEKEFLLPTLRLASLSPGGQVKTHNLIQALENIFQPTGEDAKILHGRSDTKFSQKVRNLVSHRKNRTSMFQRGLAELVDGSIRITDIGRRFLEDEGH